jgi:serine/threonine protein kinase
MDVLDFSGQTLDGKYHIERELGRGGMGTVYLANHMGTERPVAVKIISPQFMQRAEFVERFRREARAAGRLRHPNVVNVTDFGFAETSDGQVAYLVMEYLDGCTLGEILDEEKNLPVAWTLDILEQVCSAVHEAHAQGIIHRDLKPDNIWLEPNQRGGYTVKVLDFGIAKLEEHDETADHGDFPEAFKTTTPTYTSDAKTTFGGVDAGATTVGANGNDTKVSEAAAASRPRRASTLVSEAGTLHLAPVDTEGKTAIFNDGDISDEFQDTISTRISENIDPPNSGERHSTTGRSLYDSRSSAELTRVGAVLGTPLYMSPEQCRGERLDARSDIYSLGVIAYQMLSGKPPFEGDFKDVMESHKSVDPPTLRAPKVRKKMSRVIHQALSKVPDERPQTAEGFASELKSRSEGIFGLLRRALMIYSEHLPKFLTLTTFLFLPATFFTILAVVIAFLKVSELVPESTLNVALGITGIALTLANGFSGCLIIGTIAWIVTQSIAVPLRPVRLRPVLWEAKKKWKRFAGAGALSGVLPFLCAGIGAIVGFIVFAAILGIFYPLTGSVGAIFAAGSVGAVIMALVAFFWSYINFMLVSPIVMMENVRIRDAFWRSRALIKRSFATAAAAALLMFLIPAVVAGSISYVVKISARALDPKPQKPAVEIVDTAASKPPDTADPAAGTPATATNVPAPEPTPRRNRNVGFDFGFDPKEPRPEMDMRGRVKETLLESLIQILWLPMQIFVFSFSGIIVALLYLKTRLAGGESMNDLVERFEDSGRPIKKWQERVRQRLIQSGRISSNPSR